MRPVLGAALVVLLLSGCMGAANGTTVDVGIPPAPGFGSLVGTVVDEEERPVDNVTITIVEALASQATAPDGTYVFTGVPEGDYTVVAEHPHFAPVSRPATIYRDLGLTLDFDLTRLPAFAPHNVTQVFQGSYDCAAEYLIITGHCGIAWEFVTCSINYCQPDPAFKQAYHFNFIVEPRWQTIVAELAWDASATNALDGMRIYIENSNASTQAGHAKKVARADGSQNPLTVRLERGAARPEADTYEGSTVKAHIPDEGGPEQIRVFPKGQLWDVTKNACEPTRGCLLGVGAGLGIRFTVYLTIFYNEPAPSDFTAIKK